MAETNPDITIILPFYNASSTLKKALDSLVAQDFRHFECIMVDNNSNDGSSMIAKNLSRSDPRFKYVVENRQGVVYAHMKGQHLAKGRYFARMDADDISMPDRLEKQFHFLENHHEIDVLATKVEYIPHHELTEGFKRYVRWSNDLITHDQIAEKRFVEAPIINPTVMWRKDVSDSHGGYSDGPFPEDYELWLRWLDLGIRFHKLDLPLVKWYDSEKRLTRTDSRYSNESFFRIKCQYLAKWLKQNNPHHPKVMVWGASKISRRWLQHLEDQGIEIVGFIDLTEKRQLSKSVISYQNLPSPGKIFILVCLRETSMKYNTHNFLLKKGYWPKRDFLHIA